MDILDFSLFGRRPFRRRFLVVFGVYLLYLNVAAAPVVRIGPEEPIEYRHIYRYISI
ncbi:hypothetical protein BN903_7 [Halorubrum sp. AJ67]|nr:hypothetical protein BN903_7 [Halorubrum sp. AJ67]